MKTIRHPFLLSIERVEIIDQDLVIVMELADKSLQDLLEEYRKSGQSGLPRRDLLAYLRETAEVLDLMNQVHGLKHLDIKPRNLFIVGKHIKVADFGLVNSLAELYGTGSMEKLAAITPLYAAPETFQGQVTLFSDQYSLAVSYFELLTGELPIKAKNVRQLALLHATASPNLTRLPESDREAVGRALAKEPRERFPSCTAFIEALEAAVPSPSGSYPLPQARTTLFELPRQEMVKTAMVARQSAEKSSSGLYRRESRIIPAVRQPQPADGPLPGYKLLECLGRGPTGEVWRAIGPRSDENLVRFLTPPDPAQYSPEQNPIDRLLALRHRNLPALEVIAVTDQRMALISQAGNSDLMGRLKECHASGMPGIPRRELLDYFAQAADALDELYHLYQLQHLALSPRHLAVTPHQLLLLDFGMTELLWLPDDLQPAAINPRYAAPELFDGLISDACDQYSLALLFQELLVGVHPLRHPNARQMGSAKPRGQPDVTLLPALDRPIVLQALSSSPEKRFRSCREFVMALEEVTPNAEQVAVVPSHVLHSPPEQKGRVSTRSKVILPPLTALPPKPPSEQVKRDQTWRVAIEEHVLAAKRGHELLATGGLYYRLLANDHIEQRCLARLAPGLSRLKMAGFRDQWQAEPIVRGESRFVMEVRTSGSMLQRCLGRVPGVIVEVCFGSPRETASNLTPIRINLQPSASGRGQAEQLLTAMGPALLKSLQTHLNTQAERSAQERYPLTQEVHVESSSSGQTFNATVRDIGRDGLCLFAPSPLLSGTVTLTLNRFDSDIAVQVPGWVRECYPSEGGRYEIEVTFGGAAKS